MSLFHVTIAARGRATLFSDRRGLLAGVRAVTRSPRVVLFCIVDDHVHLVVDGDGSAAARAASRTLGVSGAAERLPADVRPVDGRSHLMSLVTYLARQPRKHGLVDHSAMWPGSCAPDLLGVRRLPDFSPARIDFLLPRASVRELVMGAAEVWRPALNPASEQDLAAHGPIALWHTAHAAFGLAPDDASHARVVARATWARLAGDAGRAASLVPERTFRWLRAHPFDGPADKVVRRRVSLERWAGNKRDRPPLKRPSLPPDSPNPATFAD